jgi:hypothetical protein
MLQRGRFALAAALAVGFGGLAPVPAAAAGPVIAGCPIFPADNIWNTDISTLPVHPRSAAWLASSGGPQLHLHPDWGPSGGTVPYGIPWQVVDGSHPKVPVSFDYASESDPGPYPLGPDTPIEGGAASSGDRHALVLESDTCMLYETFDTHYAPGASHAGSGAIFNLRSDRLRPSTWTSADAAGLPILPGLVRLSEVNAGAINHAIRFTVQRTDRSFLWPARHQAGSASDPNLPPMGARFRMKAGVDISRYSAAARVILTAMKHYGLILADNGSNWYFQGDADPGWGDAVLSELKTIPAGDFEAVDESSLMVSADSAQARRPGPAPQPPPPAVAPVSHPVAPPPAAPTAAPVATSAPTAVPPPPATATATATGASLIGGLAPRTPAGPSAAEPAMAGPVDKGGVLPTGRAAVLGMGALFLGVLGLLVALSARGRGPRRAAENPETL